MNRLKTLTVTVATAALVVTSLSAQARDFRLGLITPPEHLWSQQAEAFAADLHERSEGTHSVTVYPAQELGNEAQMVRELRLGELDMAFLTVAEVSNWIFDFGAFYAPYLVDDIDHAARLLRSETAAELLELMPVGADLVGLGYGMAGMRQVLSRQPIESVDDLQGLRVRITPFEANYDFYTAMGADPEPMPLPEVYGALAAEQVDAIDMDFDSILTLGFHELADNLLISNHMMFPMVGVVSRQVWRDLDEADRELIRTTMAEHLDKVVTGFQQMHADQEAEIRELGVNITEADAAFFGEAIEQWERTWSRQVPKIEVLREEAERLRE